MNLIWKIFSANLFIAIILCQLLIEKIVYCQAGPIKILAFMRKTKYWNLYFRAHFEDKLSFSQEKTGWHWVSKCPKNGVGSQLSVAMMSWVGCLLKDPDLICRK